MVEPDYTYFCRVLKITDADTFAGQVDLGFNVHVNVTFRLYGVNAPELKTPEGKAARDFVKQKMPIDTVVTVKTFKAPGDKYGRWLAKAFLPDGACLNDVLIREKLAVKYLV
jgi:endonuclease YncB( thermonuclease family)